MKLIVFSHSDRYFAKVHLNKNEVREKGKIRINMSQVNE